MGTTPQDPHTLTELALDDPEFVGAGYHDAPAAPVVVDDRAGGPMVLRVDEAELYAHSLETHSELAGGDGYLARLECTAVEALERLGRLRALRLERARDLADASLRELADTVRLNLAAAIAEVNRSEFASIAAGLGLMELVTAYKDLDHLARAEEADRAGDVERDLLRLAGAAGELVDVARGLGAETFEGRLEDLGTALERLADAAGERGIR